MCRPRCSTPASYRASSQSPPHGTDNARSSAHPGSMAHLAQVGQRERIDCTMPDEDPELLLRLDPESEACLAGIRDVILEEIKARLAVNDRDVDDPAWAERVAGLAADALLDPFQVRP